MLHFTIHDLEGVKQQVQSASDWNELTLTQLMAIEGTENINVLQLFATLTGLDLTVPEQSQDKKLEANIWRVVEFISRPPDWKSLVMPSILMIGAKAYKVPLSYKKITVGQNVLIGQAIENGEDLLLKIPDVLAILFQPIITEAGFSSTELEDIKKDLMSSNALHCYAIAVFFYLNTKVLARYGLKDSERFQRLRTPKRKLAPDWLTQIDLNNSVTFNE